MRCAGAALGGADAITVLPFTVALGQPDAFARRAARNIQIVLQEESNLGRVLDPMGGSWYIEALTDELAKTAWKLFQDIEAQGGIVAALTSGAMQDKIAADAATRAKAIATGRQELTGVSAFPLLGDDGVTVSPYPAAPKVEGKTTVRPLTPHRLGEAFEDLRDTADAHAAKTGKADKVFLASIGAVIDHTLRTTWIKNYLAAGGIGSLASDGYKNADEAAAAFKASGCQHRLHLLIRRALCRACRGDGQGAQGGRRRARADGRTAGRQGSRLQGGRRRPVPVCRRRCRGGSQRAA